MTFPLVILWGGLVSAFCVLASLYARRYNKPDALIAFYVSLILFANIAASKTIEFNLGFVRFYAPAVVLVFAVTFLVTDIVNEKFGRQETLRMIFIALFAQLAVITFSQLVLWTKPAPFFAYQESFKNVFGIMPKVATASLIAFFISESLDAYLFSWLVKKTQGRKLWLRNAFSSIPAMLIDSAIFCSLAFYGLMPVGLLILGQTAIKWIVAIIDIPFMYISRYILTSEKINFNIMPHNRKKQIVSVLIFAGLGLLALQVPLTYVLGSQAKFTLFDAFGPIATGFLTTPVGVLVVFLTQFVNFLIHGAQILDAGTVIRFLPMLFGAFYFGKKSKLNIFIPLLAILIFNLHPEGRGAWQYSLFWLIPIACHFLRDKFLLARSLGATFMAHSVGGALWVWVFNLPKTFWLNLIPVTAMERAIFALGIAFMYVMVNNLVKATLKEKSQDFGLTTDAKYLAPGLKQAK